MAAPKTGITIRVVHNELGRIPSALRALVVQQVKTTTFDGQARAMQLCPVRTGTLRRSIHSVFENGGLTGIYGPSVHYGIYVELGTRRMGARPYMRPSAEYVLPHFAESLKAIMRGDW